MADQTGEEKENRWQTAISDVQALGLSVHDVTNALRVMRNSSLLEPHQNVDKSAHLKVPVKVSKEVHTKGPQVRVIRFRNERKNIRKQENKEGS